MSDDDVERVDVWKYLDTAHDCNQAEYLYRWGLNYDRSDNPFLLFLDVIGWSEKSLGGRMSELEANYDFAGIKHLTDALAEYVDKPEVVEEWVEGLMNCDNV